MDFLNASFLYTTLQFLSTLQSPAPGREVLIITLFIFTTGQFICSLSISDHSAILILIAIPCYFAKCTVSSYSSYFVLIIAAVAVPRLLVNGNRTGGAAAAEVHTGDSPSCNRPLLRPAAWVARSESEKSSARRARIRKKTRVRRQFLHVSYAETPVHTAG